MSKILQQYLSKEILEYEYELCGSMQKMSTKLNISVDTVYKYMKLYNILPYKNHKKTYNCNENFFKNDTPESFYLAGFLAADGSVQYRKYSDVLKITLSKKDKDHLEKIKILLKSNHPIKDYIVKPSKLVKSYNESSELQIVSNNIIADLKRFNIIPNKTKTYTYTIPENIVNNQLISHFMRGYFDGDGTITFCGLSKNRTVKQLSFSILGTEFFIDQYRNLLINNCKINSAKIVKHSNVFKISYSGNNVVKKIYEFLYDNKYNISLKRKFDIFNKVYLPI